MIGSLARRPVQFWRKEMMGIEGKVAVVAGGASGIGRLAASAMEGTARQPEATGDIRLGMIIAAALIEGFTFFAIVVCLLLTF